MNSVRNTTQAAAAAVGPPIAVAIRRAIRNGYGLADLRADVMAGLVVGVVALPLSMALAVASGVAPQHGLYTAIVAGGLIALLGGSKVQVSGPTAAFVVILAPIAAKFGLGGLLVASMLAGMMLLLIGMARMGRLIEFIPYPVTTGFTAGIAVVIATLQINDFLGLGIAKFPEHYLQKVQLLGAHIAALRHGWASWPNFAVGAFTLALLLVLPKVTQRVPAPIIALPAGALLALLLPRLGIDAPVATILTRFPETHGVPQMLPSFTFPWMLATPSGQPVYELLTDGEQFKALLGSAFAIAMLGAIESLLSAVVADGMTGKRHDPDSELVAQGIGNIAAPFFGGFAATGAIARTATNIRYGARSPLASITHAFFLLIVMVAAAPLLGYLPMASMAAMLLVVARNMAEVKHFVHILRVAPRSDILVLLACFSLTVIFDMVVSVSVGVVLAAMLFMGRMAEASQVTLVGEEHADSEAPLPPGIRIYQVAGPLFFGAAQRAMGAFQTVEDHVRVLILDLRNVPTLDATGLVALESTLEKLHRRKVFVVIAGVQNQPLHLMAKAGWKHRPWLIVMRSYADAIALSRTLSASDFEHSANLSEA